MAILTMSESLSKPQPRQKQQQGWTTKQSAMGGDEMGHSSTCW